MLLRNILAGYAPTCLYVVVVLSFFLSGGVVFTDGVHACVKCSFAMIQGLCEGAVVGGCECVGENACVGVDLYVPTAIFPLPHLYSSSFTTERWGK